MFVVRLAGLAPDDFFITYRYARNFAHGDGFVYNVGERVFGCTDPGLGLLLGALHAVTRAPVPLIGTVVYAASLLGIAVVLYLVARQRGRGLEAILGGSLLLISSYVWANQGAAVPFALLLLLVSSVLATRLPTLAGIVAGAAVWVRPEAGLGVALLALLLIRERRISWRFVVSSGALMAAGLGVAWRYFGQPLPNTFGAKMEMAAANPDNWAGVRFWPRALVAISRHFGPEWPAVLIVGVAGCGFLASGAGRSGRLVALFGVVLAVFYPFSGVPFYSWYILPCLVAVIYGLAFLVGAAGRFLSSRAPSLERWRTPIVICAAGLLAMTTVRTGWMFLWGAARSPHVQSYVRAAEWIRSRSDTRASIAYVEIGVLGYYSERPIVDLMGLVTPRARPFVLRNDLLGALREKPAEFVLFHSRGRMASVVGSRWFKRRYREVLVLDDPGDLGRPGILRIYRLRPRFAENRPGEVSASAEE